MTAASNIQGTGAQNLARAMRNGRIAVSGIALGPYLASSVRTSPLVRPFDGLSSTLTCAAFVGMDGLVMVGGIVSQGPSNRDIYRLILFCGAGGCGTVHLSTLNHHDRILQGCSALSGMGSRVKKWAGSE